MTTPTRTEFEAAAYRWLRDVADGGDWERIGHTTTPTTTDGVIAAAMGWPTVPPAPTPKEPTEPPAAGQRFMVYGKGMRIAIDDLHHGRSAILAADFSVCGDFSEAERLAYAQDICDRLNRA